MANSVDIGIREVGEISEPLNYQFLDNDGVALNVSGYSVALWVKKPDGTTGSVAGSVVGDGSTGTVQIPWDSAVQTDQVGKYLGTVWITGTYTLPSVKLAWTVRDGPGPA